MHQSLLAFRNFRYLWLALALSVASMIAYAWQSPTQPANGGTWLGYTLGTLAALLVLWLTALGVRKRSYRSQLGTMQGWVSAHVYLGLSLLIVATLHTGFQFGANVHTLAYVLMCGIMATGVLGVILYLRFPRELSNNRAGLTRLQLTEQLAELDERSSKVAAKLPREFAEAITSNRDRVRLGDSVVALLLGRDRSQIVLSDDGARPVSNSGQSALLTFLSERLARSSDGALSRGLAELLSLTTARRVVLERLRRDAQIKAWLEIWLHVHVPLTFAMLAALIAHVVSVFLYW